MGKLLLDVKLFLRSGCPRVAADVLFLCLLRGEAEFGPVQQDVDLNVEEEEQRRKRDEEEKEK